MTANEEENPLLERSDLTPLKKALEDCKGAFYFMVCMALVITIISIAPILYTMNVFDRVIPTNSIITLVSLLTLVIGCYFFWTALEWMRNRMMVRISLRIDWDLAADVFDACFKKSLNQKDPNVHQVMGDLLTLRQFLTGRSVITLIDAPFAVLFMVFAYLIHPLLALFVVVATLILIVITLYTRKITTPAIRAANQNNMEANKVAASSLRNADTAFAMGMLPSLRQRWHEKHRTFLHYQINSSEASGFIGMIGGVFTKALPTLKITVGVMLAGSGAISVGGVIAAGFVMSKAISPLRELILKWEDIVRARMAYERLDALLNQQTVERQKMELPDPKGHLSIENFYFREPTSGRDILKGINFDLPAGQIMAIVGPNAAGKTTLLRSILGIIKPSLGFVRLDGAEVWDWDHEHLGKHIGYVAQSANLFDATVAENIARLGVVNSEEVVRASELAGIHEMILSFPQGYDTLLGDGGHQPSGGQSQRITIARALYMRPKLVVLDEPNANLDEPAERALLNALISLRESGSTVVFTSHRPKLIACSNWLLVMKDGQQVKFGKTSEILGARPELTAKVSTEGQVPTSSTLLVQAKDPVAEAEEENFDGRQLIQEEEKMQAPAAPSEPAVAPPAIVQEEAVESKPVVLGPSVKTMVLRESK